MEYDFEAYFAHTELLLMKCKYWPEMINCYLFTAGVGNPGEASIYLNNMEETEYNIMNDTVKI